MSGSWFEHNSFWLSSWHKCVRRLAVLAIGMFSLAASVVSQNPPQTSLEIYANAMKQPRVADQIAELERYLSTLGSIAAMAPLLGLLGTVLGMIDIFGSFTNSGMTTNAAILAGGISKALICTASGLMVGIPAIFFHRFLQSRVDELVVGMEQEAIKLVEVVQGDRDVDLAEGKA